MNAQATSVADRESIPGSLIVACLSADEAAAVAAKLAQTQLELPDFRAFVE
ncbi:hypothetical protein THICB2_760074 [Thiomonas sp. CB2]|uniref:Uncharacterized protein n=1 Tax=Thiomonas delicata TaxID=364030 RepID=A0A238D7I3_THIDL|nr:hypothetical protein THICB2_760074 [Thiomonas sp. CB2]CQR44615.1 hypothetical protein THICB3550041 [Thiomonas sp. CB3]SBP89094.1 hypothetical protein THIARS_70714 [Thiomonas delicata]VDY06800.1 protein of unknown function [Thiomonas sp. Bio17B3]VDY09904.1 protein of unknown function [Thiomonas sp. Sup16B3]VDY15075.1 conserved protein of unknown function [Thiomonas sp. OC7]